MLSKKYFLAGELDFSTPLVRPARANVTDHIESQESDHRASYMSYRGLQQRRQLKTDFREILGAAQFSTSSTAIDHLEKLATGNTDGMRYWQMGNTFLNDYSADSKIRWFALQPTNSSWHSAATPILFHADEVIG